MRVRNKFNSDEMFYSFSSVWCWWLVVWPCLWDHTWASKRLDVCSEESQYDLGSGSGNVSGSGSGSGPDLMPPVLYFQTSTRSTTRPVRMNYAWSTVGFPTLFLSQSFGARNCSKSSFSVNASDYERSQKYGSVRVAGAGSEASLAIVFRRLIRFDGGCNHKAANAFNSSRAAEVYESVYLNESIEWSYDGDKKQIVGTSLSSHFQSLTFNFQLPWTEEDRRISYFPKTKYTRNSTVFDVTILGFNYTGLKNGRLALEMIMVNGQQVNRSSTKVTSTVDDEYTPSVFRMWEYYFNDRGSPNPAYLQWKPISYQSRVRRSTKSQEANIVYPIGHAIDILVSQLPSGLASALFNDSTSLNGTAMYIVMGTDGDDTYVDSGYQTWTAVVGFGRVPRDQISAEVIIIIIVALGVPALLIFIGSIYVTYKKKPWQLVVRRLHRVDGYETIN